MKNVQKGAIQTINYNLIFLSSDIELKRNPHRRVREAKRLYDESYLIQLKFLDDCITPERLKNIIVPIVKLGDIALKVEQNKDEARIWFSKALSISQQLINDYGETPVRINALNKYRDIMVSLM